MAMKPASAVSPHASGAAPPSGSNFDVIVIGGGTLGLSAAYYAAARGLNTLLLEQFDSLANPEGGSGGASRMFRVMYSPAYMAQLAEISLALWQEIEVASGTDILWTQPLLFYGDAENTVEGNLGTMREILAKLGAPYAWYPDATSIMQANPGFQTMPQEYVGLAQPNSAVIRAQESVTAFASLATNAGATLLVNQPATIATINPPYQVNCPAGPYTANALILCPGAWTNAVLQPLSRPLNLTIWQMTVAYFQADVTNFNYPLWYEFGPNEQSLFYGFPPDEMPGYLKVSADFTNFTVTDPGQLTYQPDPQILAQLGSFLQQRFNGVQATPSNATTCLYTMSADYQMILDRFPNQNIAIFTGDSGRGFKFTPLFGRILVDLATTGQTYYDISPFAMTRPGIIQGSTGPAAQAARRIR
jgi:monomeric sarcosine oxidase